MKEKNNSKLNVDVLDKEIETFTKIYNHLNENLLISILTDIIGNSVEIKEEDNKKILDFTKFDQNVKNIKKMLKNLNSFDNLTIQNIDVFKNSIRDDIKQYEHMKNECIISIRELSWIKDLIEGEKDA